MAALKLILAFAIPNNYRNPLPAVLQHGGYGDGR